MSLEERKYNLLVVSHGEKLNRALESLLPKAVFSPVRFAESVSEAKRILAEQDYDLAIVNSPLPDGPGIDLAVDLCEAKPTIAALLVRAELHDEIYAKVMRHGVFTLPKPLSKSSVTQALQWMATARERQRSMQRKSLSMEEKMAEIRLVNRAKWLLIERRGMDEPQAHRYLEKQAMDRCATKRDVAEAILREYETNLN